MDNHVGAMVGPAQRGEAGLVEALLRRRADPAQDRPATTWPGDAPCSPPRRRSRCCSSGWAVVHPGWGEGPGVHRVPADPGAADRSGPGRCGLSRQPAARGEGAVIAIFRDEAQVLLSTELAGEGRYLRVLPRHGEHGPAVEPDADRAVARSGWDRSLGSGARRAADEPGLASLAPSSSRSCTCSRPRRTCSSWGSGRTRDDPRAGWTTTSTSRPRRSTRSSPRKTTRSSASGWRVIGDGSPGPSQDRLPGQPRVDRQPAGSGKRRTRDRRPRAGVLAAARGRRWRALGAGLGFRARPPRPPARDAP